MSATPIQRLLTELRRRKLFGMLALYVIGAWVVLQAAALMFPGWQIPDSAIRFVWIGAALLFPIAVVFSWRYDISASGLRRTPARAADQGPELKRIDVSLLSLMAALTIAISGTVMLQVLNARNPGEPTIVDSEIPVNSIAVLPFVNMSDNEENEYFSDGITEQLLNELARIPELHVAARTSSFHFKGRDEDMRAIGRQLGVRTLLEGSVRRFGDSVRITAQLIDAENGFHLWSQTYDRELDDIFVVQDDIATAIVDTLRLTLRERDQARLHAPVTTNAQAFDIYLQAMDVRRQRSSDAVQQSNELMAEALDMAPDFALAHAELAYGKVLQAWYGSLTIDDATLEASDLLERALAIDPELEQAYGAYGLLYTIRRDHEAANTNFERALEINPGYYSAHVNYGLALVRQGRLKEASASYLRAQTLDPLNANLNFNLGAVMMLMGEFDGGVYLLRRAGELDATRDDIEPALSHWNRTYGRLAESMEIATRVYSERPEHIGNAMTLAQLNIDAGRLAEARRILAEAREINAQHGRVRDVQWALWLADEDYEAVHQYALDQYRSVDAAPGEQLSFGDARRVYFYAWSALVRGEFETAAENLHWAVGGEEGLEATTYDEMEHAKLLSLAYRRLGREAESAAIATRCLALADDAHERGWATPQLFYRVAEIHAGQNDAQQAIESLERAYERGWREIMSLEHSLYWEEMRDNPELERIKRMIYDDIERQLPLDVS